VAKSKGGHRGGQSIQEFMRCWINIKQEQEFIGLLNMETGDLQLAKKEAWENDFRIKVVNASESKGVPFRRAIKKHRRHCKKARGRGKKGFSLTLQACSPVKG